jgi:NADPH-dependent 2,4-dienoyl-CoA reductase/sulfur reductase-like enzyme
MSVAIHVNFIAFQRQALKGLSQCGLRAVQGAHRGGTHGRLGRLATIGAGPIGCEMAQALPG